MNQAPTVNPLELLSPTDRLFYLYLKGEGKEHTLSGIAEQLGIAVTSAWAAKETLLEWGLVEERNQIEGLELDLHATDKEGLYDEWKARRSVDRLLKQVKGEKILLKLTCLYVSGVSPTAKPVEVPRASGGTKELPALSMKALAAQIGVNYQVLTRLLRSKNGLRYLEKVENATGGTEIFLQELEED